MQGLYQLLQNSSGYEEWIAFRVYAIVRDATHTHDPTTLNRQGNDVGTQYRSGIYYDQPEHGEVASAMIRQMSQDKLFSAPITTEVAPLSNYSTAEAYHQDYFANHPHAGYCAFVVGPKVEKFRKTFARYLKD